MILRKYLIAIIAVLALNACVTKSNPDLPASAVFGYTENPKWSFVGQWLTPRSIYFRQQGDTVTGKYLDPDFSHLTLRGRVRGNRLDSSMFNSRVPSRSTGRITFLMSDDGRYLQGVIENEGSIENKDEWNFIRSGAPITIAQADKEKKSIKIGQKTAAFSSDTNAPIKAVVLPTNEFPKDSLDIKFHPTGPYPDDIAVIIGNANYRSLGQDIPNVIPAYTDAEGFKKYAIEALGIRPGNIIDLRDASLGQLFKVFGSTTNHRGKLFNWVKPGKSRVFIYYSGHGAPAGSNGSAYLIPANADASAIEVSAYPLAALYKNLGKVPAKSITRPVSQ